MSIIPSRRLALLGVAALYIGVALYAGQMASVKSLSESSLSTNGTAIEFIGEPLAVDALKSGQARSRALATADFNGDAAPDVVAGYENNGAGLITIQLGNTDAFAPTDDSVFVRMQQGYDPPSLRPAVASYQVPEPVELMQAGDFNSDGRSDVLFASRGGGLFIVEGDGRGGFGSIKQIDLPGSVSALTSGEFRAADGPKDIAIAITAPDGPEVLLYDGALGGLKSEPFRFALNGPATTMEFGELDSDPFRDLLVAADSTLYLIHGWGRKTDVEARSQVESLNVQSQVAAVRLGHFIWDREGSPEIATLAGDGTLNVLQRKGLNTERFSEAELSVRNRGNWKPQASRQVDVEELAGWNGKSKNDWAVARTLNQDMGFSDNATPPVLEVTNIYGLENEDITVSNRKGLGVIRQVDKAGPQYAFREAATFISSDMTEFALNDGDASAVLQLPRKLNGVRDLVTLSSSGPIPQAISFAPNTTITVDRTDDPSGAALTAASACTAALNDCSLRGAIQFANLPANSNTTISLPANTYILSINGTNAVGCDGNTVGDLGANTTMSIVGAGAATTIIRQTGTGPANDGDRVMCMNEPFTINLIYNFSGVTFVGGRDGTSAGTGSAIGGGGIIGGESGNVLTMTSVVMANNQVTVLGSGNIGGGGIQITGGTLNITNSTFGGSSAPGAYTDRTSTNTANHNAGSGGGVMYTPSAPAHTGGSGTLTVTGSTFTRNTVGSVCCG
jgi:hypothetical protein